MLPGFLGSATPGGAYKVYPFPVNDVNLNIGSPWSTTTYTFTCPVAGIYYTSYSGIVGIWGDFIGTLISVSSSTAATGTSRIATPAPRGNCITSR